MCYLSEPQTLQLIEFHFTTGTYMKMTNWVTFSALLFISQTLGQQQLPEGCLTSISNSDMRVHCNDIEEIPKGTSCFVNTHHFIIWHLVRVPLTEIQTDKVLNNMQLPKCFIILMHMSLEWRPNDQKRKLIDLFFPYQSIINTRGRH